jgi:hypothetical protein
MKRYWRWPVGVALFLMFGSYPLGWLLDINNWAGSKIFYLILDNRPTIGQSAERSQATIPKVVAPKVPVAPPPTVAPVPKPVNCEILDDLRERAKCRLGQQ